MAETIEKWQRQLSDLRGLADSDRLHHAFLILSPQRSASLHFAQKFSAYLLRGMGLMGATPEEEVLERILRSGHPDLVWIRPEKELISVDDVRSLHKELSYAPLEAARRVVILEDAQFLHPKAANAILKVLEEPPPHSIFLLTCTDSDLVLPTIRSRCFRMVLPQYTEPELAKLLREEAPDRSALEITAALRGAEGSLERARALLLQEETRVIWDRARTELLAMWKVRPRITPEMLALAEELSENDEARHWAFQSWTVLLRDFTMHVCGEETKDSALGALAQDWKSEIERKQGDFLQAVHGLASGSRAIHQAEGALRGNANGKLVMDWLVTKLQATLAMWNVAKD